MRLSRVVLLLVAGLLIAAPVAAGTTDSVYREPSQVLVDIVDAPLPPGYRIGPRSEWLLSMSRRSLPSIAELAEEELRLAGVRIKAQTNGPSRSFLYSGLTLLRMDDPEERQVSGLPKGARIDNLRWSPDGARIAFTNTTAHGIELWIAEVETASAKRILGPRLNLSMWTSPTWLADSRHLVCTLVPENRGPRPVESRVPEGPVVQENLGRTAPARTYQDLLEDPHDEALFEHFFTAQLARIGLDGSTTPLGNPAIIGSFDPSPDGRFLLVQTVHRPFSYLVPVYRFPVRIEVWNQSGELVHTVADLPLRDDVPTTFGSVALGPREVEWRSDVPATLVWVEAQDGGDAGAEAEIRDRLFSLSAPFSGTPSPMMDFGLRYGGVTWGDDELALVAEWWWKTRMVRAWRVRPNDPESAPELLDEHSFQDRYSDPGEPVTVPNAWGRRVLLTAGDSDSIFLVGDGASPEGDRPFLDRHDLKTRQKERLFHSQSPHYERPLRPLSPDGSRLLIRRESVEQPPNLFLHDSGSDEPRQITSYPHPTPQQAGISKELIKYQREDGVELTATLHLPKGYSVKEDPPLPIVLWAYPNEYKSADDAGQVRDSPYRFDRLAWYSPLVWLTRGYAVLYDPAMPIIGEGDEEPNDTFVSQLVASASAAIDEVVRRGVAEPHRVAIAGHSYGAFMTANLLAHSDLFATGVARSGAYNRTLTPFGFQAEERTVWQAPELYFAMSPFMHAEKIDEPILLIHGQVDNNSGTFPMQSERFYNAIKGLGGSARLVMLPHESHGYRARESVLHVLWETERWFDTYLKNAEPREVKKEGEQGSAEQ